MNLHLIEVYTFKIIKNSINSINSRSVLGQERTSFPDPTDSLPSQRCKNTRHPEVSEGHAPH